MSDDIVYNLVEFNVIVHGELRHPENMRVSQENMTKADALAYANDLMDNIIIDEVDENSIEFSVYPSSKIERIDVKLIAPRVNGFEDYNF